MSLRHAIRKLSGGHVPVCSVGFLGRLANDKFVAIDTIGFNLEKGAFGVLRRGRCQETMAGRILLRALLAQVELVDLR